MLNPSTDMWLAIRTTVSITIISRVCTDIVVLLVVLLLLLLLPLLVLFLAALMLFLMML